MITIGSSEPQCESLLFSNIPQKFRNTPQMCLLIFFSYEKNEAWLSSAVQLKVKSKLESHLKHNGSPGVVGTTTAKTKQNKKLPKECKQRMVMLVKSTTVN